LLSFSLFTAHTHNNNNKKKAYSKNNERNKKIFILTFDMFINRRMKMVIVCQRETSFEIM
jgi:hypothetical protein